VINVTLSKRQTDDFGSGYFGAGRGSRTHNGIDYACFAGSTVLSPVRGVVTILGYPYADDFDYRYVQVTDNDGLRHRIFYCLPSCSVGDVVCKGDGIGEAQDISARYDTEDKKMNNHIHYEILDSTNSYLNPEDITHGT
jgi:hypothetical protein